MVENDPKYRDLPTRRVSGTFTPQGLKNPLIVEWEIYDDRWTKIFDAPFEINGSVINAINIQNQTGVRIIMNYSDMGAASIVGIRIGANGERQYMLQGNPECVIWARTEPGNGTANGVIEKIA